MRRLILLAVLAVSCSRPSRNAPTEYSPADGSFSASVPGGWLVDDAPGLTRKAAFFGPPGAGKFAESMRVSLHPGETPETYRAGRKGTTPLTPANAGGLKAWEFRGEDEFRDPHAARTTKLALRVVAVPTAAGLYVLEHAWPAAEAGSAADFERLVSTFKPKSP